MELCMYFILYTVHELKTWPIIKCNDQEYKKYIKSGEEDGDGNFKEKKVFICIIWNIFLRILHYFIEEKKVFKKWNMVWKLLNWIFNIIF
jgi:hypothetical protein